jgi:hypothetical protein
MAQKFDAGCEQLWAQEILVRATEALALERATQWLSNMLLGNFLERTKLPPSKAGEMLFI